MPTWKVELVPEAREDFNSLDGSVRKRVLKQLVKLEQNPNCGDPYYCAHGFLHRDVMLPKGKTEKQLLSIANLNDALQYAEQDIKDRWQWYKERYIKGLRK